MDPTKGKKKITDDKAIPAINEKIYGYKNCVKINKNRFFLEIQGITPLTRAECPMMLAKGNYQRRLNSALSLLANIVTLHSALYLQIQGKPTYWSTGVVDKDSLQPVVSLTQDT